jgi:hypothetical protein
MDPKLRKGEIKITVIASGFPTGAPARAKQREERKGRPINAVNENTDENDAPDLFEKKQEERTLEVNRLHPQKENSERAIFNTIPSVKEEKDARRTIDIEDEDLGVIPSFLRRSKLR